MPKTLPTAAGGARQNPSYNAKLPSSKLLTCRGDGSAEAVAGGYGVSLLLQNCVPSCREEAMTVECGMRAYIAVLPVKRQVSGK